MDLQTFKLLAGVTIFFTSFIVGWLPIHARTKYAAHVDFSLGAALASGVFLGAALFHMLPDAERGFRSTLGTLHYPYAHLIGAASFIVLLLFEKILFQLAALRNVYSKNLIPTILFLVLSIHALIAGAAVGINTTISAAFVIFIAIIAHKGFESFALVVTLNQSELTIKKIIFMLITFSLATPLGIFLGSLITNLLQTHAGSLTEASFNAIAAGTFLYIAIFHNIGKRSAQRVNYFYQSLFILFGILLMALLAFLV